MAKRILTGLLCVIVLTVLYFFLQPKIEEVTITFNDKKYTMLETTLEEFMDDGYSIAQVTYSDKGIELTRYDNSYLEGRTLYSVGVPLRPNGASEWSKASISASLFNPEEKSVISKKGVIARLTCEMELLKETGVSIEIAGMQLESQNKKEVLDWMDENLKGFEKGDGSIPNAFHYQSGLSSYTFVFDENDLIKRVIANKEPSYTYSAN